MAKRKKKKIKLILHASPGKIRRVWAVKPGTRVVENGRRGKLEKIRNRESRRWED